jgi:hypothetical protein
LKPEYHVVISLVLSLVFYLLTGSFLGTLFVFLVGVFIDVDHFIDLSIEKSRITLNPWILFDYSYNHKFKKLRLFFHSIELIPVIFLLGNLIFGRLLTYGILLGFTSHLVADILGNSVKPTLYFLSLRIFKKFDPSSFRTFEKY